MEDNFRKFVAKTLILIFPLCLFVFLNIAIASASPPQEIKLTNVRDTIFTVSWITNQAEKCQINYGPTPALGSVAYDVRGSSTTDDTHYVTITGLSPNTLYYFDIVSGSVTYNNGGAHYTCTTGPTILSPPGSETVYGRVFKQDSVTYANGTIVYIKLKDNNGEGSPGSSAEMSTLVDSSGYWFINLGNAKTQDLNAYFSYSSSGDNLILYAQGAGDGTVSQTIDTAADSPAANMVLFIVLDVEVGIFNDTGYSQQDKFFNEGNTVYIQANVTSAGSPVEGATVSANLKVSAGTVTEATVSLTEVGGGIYRGSWSSTAHTADVYLVEVNVTNPTGSGQAYFHLYPGSKVSTYRIDYDEDGNNDYVLENKHLISVYDGISDTDKLLIYLEQKDTGLNYTFKTISDPDSKGRGETTTTSMDSLRFSSYAFSSTGESLTSSDLDMVAYIKDTTPVTASFNLSIKMESQDVDYLVYNLSNFNEYIDNIGDLFSDIAGTIGANVEDDRYHIGDGTDNLVTTLTSSTWTDFSATGKLEKYVAIYDNSTLNDPENNNVIGWVHFSNTAYLTFDRVGVWRETGKEALRIKYNTSSASNTDELNYILVFTRGGYQDIAKWMPTIYSGIYPSPNFMATPSLVLGITVQPTSWAIGNITGEQPIQSGLFTVTNTGTMSETFNLNIQGPSSPSGWIAGSSPGAEIYVMKGLFGGTAENPTGLFFWDDVILIGSPSAATDAQFGVSSWTLNGANVEVSGQRGLWFEFQAPSSSSHGGQQQSITIVVGAEPP